MKASEIEIEFINFDYSPALTERCKLSDLKALERAQDKEITLICAPQKWIDQNIQMPKHNDKILFIVKDEVRLGVFLQYDQWNRENIFCDGAFHFTDKVKGWMMCPSASEGNGA